MLQTTPFNSTAGSTALIDTTSCGACGGPGMVPFYEIGSVPVHSVLLMPTQEAAVSYPRGDIRLAYCPHCGFAGNSVFDESFNDYCQQYEETQGFSPTFNVFHKRLASHLVERYGIRNKQVIEIGCGKGEFLALICEAGANRGIGFDPSYVPERGVASTNIHVVQDLFSDKYAESYEADFVCCKMTMEHIASPRKLVQAARKLLKKRPDGLAFFQIPDFGHVLDTAAFWDVYYEHCSYFTAASLRSLFEEAGFEVLAVEREYAGQYLTIIAKPAGQEATKPGLARPDQTFTNQIVSFADRVAASVKTWEQRIRRHTDAGGRAVLWGGGSKAVAFLSTVPVDDAVHYAVDINPYRQGTYLAGSGKLIVGPEFLRGYQPTLVIVMNPVYVEEITRDLATMGLSPEVAALGQ
jgi:SAM-dependent methyltransferase